MVEISKKRFFLKTIFSGPTFRLRSNSGYGNLPSHQKKSTYRMLALFVEDLRYSGTLKNA